MFLPQNKILCQTKNLIVPHRPEMDDETYEFIQKMFQLARNGTGEQMKSYLEGGLPPNIRDGKGNSFLMLATYNGNYDRGARADRTRRGSAGRQRSRDRFRSPERHLKATRR